MKAIAISQPGSPDVLKICERPRPEPKVGEVLIKVHAAGVNRPDVAQRLGRYPAPPGASDLPGLEIAGEIVAGDLSNCEFKLGDMVCALVQGGGYAEYCTAPTQQCLPVPSGLTPLEAASLPETFFTVWSNVFDRGHLSPGETLLVQGGSSGIGVAAIQIATALGHRVFATAGTDEKCHACDGLGAERTINYKTENFGQVVMSLTEGKGVDVILDMVGGDYVRREIDALADDGRLLLIAVMGGAEAGIDLGQILRRRLTITGSTLRPRPPEFKAAVASKLRHRVWPLFGSGLIKPVIFREFPMAEAAKAHELIESGQHIGKIMLRMV
jgi:NADPH2:quinone reductase